MESKFWFLSISSCILIVSAGLPAVAIPGNEENLSRSLSNRPWLILILLTGSAILLLYVFGKGILYGDQEE